MDETSAFLRMLEARFGTVGDAMTRKVVTLDPTMRASEAAVLLSEAGVTGGPVLEEGRVIGILTLGDLERVEGRGPVQTTGPFLRGDRRLAGLTVADVMTREVVCAREHWPLTTAITVMDEVGVNRLPVIDLADRPVGILARDDVVRAIAATVRECRDAACEPAHPGRPKLEAD
ncbi:MAG TPA: CBS domain-containing protein [Actinomycetota bacterium]|nr:CBS domain-containing protein [Actinomycetota bacterium]